MAGEGLRERRRRRTVAAIHHAALRLFAERGFGAVTVTDIAEAAEVSRATVFAYFPTKEDIVLGDSPAAIERLRSRLEEPGTAVMDGVRAWLRELGGWIDADILLQRRLADEVPAVAAARARVQRGIEDVIAGALARELDGDDPLPARLAASALASSLGTVEAEAARRLEAGRPSLDPEEIDALLDVAVAFVDGGLERLAADRARAEDAGHG